MRLLWVSAIIVLVDQVAKFTVLQTMFRGQSISLIGDWLQLTFTENPGMAFGISFGPPGLITGFSIIATMLIVVYLIRIRYSYTPYRLSLAFILGGAIGNIIDRLFYGMILGYGTFFQGKVVDFIHVNIWRGYIPEGVPMVGGNYFSFFPIWNLADMAIVGGVVGLLFFQKKFHQEYLSQLQQAMPEVVGEDLSAETPDITPSPTNGLLTDSDSVEAGSTDRPDSLPES